MLFHKSLRIDLIEPIVYLHGPKDSQSVNILRGVVHLQLKRPVPMQSLTINFLGTSKTLWPEATHHWDKQILVDSIIPICKTPMYLKKGAHAFPFEILLSSALSESIECGLGHVRYKVICQLHTRSDWRASYSFLPFSPIVTKLQAKQSVVLVRLPPRDTPRCISQTHNITPHDQLDMVVESAHLTTGAFLPVSFHFSNPDSIFSLDKLTVKLIERQKFRAPSKQTTRILHHEITLQPQSSHTSSVGPDETRFVYWIPDSHSLQVHPTTTNRIIRVRHWIQVALTLTLTNGETKDFWMDTPISVLLSPLDDYHTLPVYQCLPPSPSPSPSPPSPPPAVTTLSSSSSSSWNTAPACPPSSSSFVSTSINALINKNKKKNNSHSSFSVHNASNHHQAKRKPSMWISQLYTRHREMFRSPSSSLLLPPSSSSVTIPASRIQPSFSSSSSSSYSPSTPTPPPIYEEHSPP